jgi:hypothetical protein
MLLLSLLLGCMVTDVELFAALDRDGDGVLPPEAGGRDCDNGDPRVRPGRVEVCGDGIDNDCDGVIDDDGRGATLWYVDDDGDGWGDSSTEPVSACSELVGRAADIHDCDDSDPVRNPAQEDLCNGVDDDCDGDVDEDAEFTEWFPDVDGDGAGAIGAGVILCGAPGTGWTTDGSDCDDTDSSVGAVIWYRDEDGDNWGTPDDTVADCTEQPGYVERGGDCDDGNHTIHPDAFEFCGNGIDDDCSGTSDGCGLLRSTTADHIVPASGSLTLTSTAVDIDQDGWLDMINSGATSATVVVGPLSDALGPELELDASMAAVAGEFASGPVLLVSIRDSGSEFWGDGDTIAGMVQLPSALKIFDSEVPWSLVGDADDLIEAYRPISTDLNGPSVATSAGVGMFPASPGRYALDDYDALFSSGGAEFFGSQITGLGHTPDGASTVAISDPATDGKEVFESPSTIWLFDDASDRSGIIAAEDATARIVDDAPFGFGLRLEAGDLDDDGHDDLVASAPRGGEVAGSVDVFLGPFDADLTRADRWTTAGDALPLGAGFGAHDLAVIDGTTHLVVGAPLFGGVVTHGRVYVLRPVPGVLSLDDAVGILDAEETGTMGSTLFVADINQDSFDDIVTGSGLLTSSNTTHIFLGASL